MKQSIYIGFDPKEIAAYLVAVGSITRLSPSSPIPRSLELGNLIQRGLYTRPTEVRDGRLFDVISDHPMSTEFACSRFLTPLLAETGWALFADCDVMARCDLQELFDLADPRYAVMCVQHSHKPTNKFKMDNQVQSVYSRKNWSSVCLWNCDHPANAALTVERINSVPGRDLHAFDWLQPQDIGALPFEFNFLVGSSPSSMNPKLVHFTEGTPHTIGYEDCAYSDEWRRELAFSIPSVLTALET